MTKKRVTVGTWWASASNHDRVDALERAYGIPHPSYKYLKWSQLPHKDHIGQAT